MFKKLLVHTKKSMKLFILIAFSVAIIAAIVIIFFQPTYTVKINGEPVGYTQNKKALQERINEYSEKGNGEDSVAFIQIPSMPEYEVCMIKRDIKFNDDEIFDLIKQEGIKYYRYYAIAENQEEKFYVRTFPEAEDIVQTLKDKDSTNIDKISIIEKYETELKDYSLKDTIVTALYKERPKVVVAKKTYRAYAATGSVNTATDTGGGAPELGISLIRPVSGIITSRFAERSSIRSSSHTGLDIATSSGTPIAAAASGTVSFSGWKGSYGNLLVISHGNGVQTYYAHCSALYATAGDQVSQGDTIAAVGSTGNSTGPHLHLEIRVDGVAYNPQNYLY